MARALPTKDLPSPGRMPSNPFRQLQLQFLLYNRHSENFTLYTYKENLFYGGNIRERAAKTNSWRTQVPCAPSRCSRAMELPQLQFAPAFAENWSHTSGMELRSSLESGMCSCHSLPNPRSSVLLAVSSLPQLSSSQTPYDEVWTTKGRVALICPSIPVSLSDIYKRLIVTLNLNFKWSAFKSEMPSQINNWDYHYLPPIADLVWDQCFFILLNYKPTQMHAPLKELKHLNHSLPGCGKKLFYICWNSKKAKWFEYLPKRKR